MKSKTKSKKNKINGRKTVNEFKPTSEITSKNIFISSEHERIYNCITKQHEIQVRADSKKFMACVYILSSNQTLWTLTKRNIYLNGIVFDSKSIKGVGTQNYALYKFAKYIWNDELNEIVGELKDKTLLSESTYKVITNAIKILKTTKH